MLDFSVYYGKVTQMDIETFECLETAGLITEAQRESLVKITTKLPQNEQDLLQVIAAVLILQLEYLAP